MKEQPLFAPGDTERWKKVEGYSRYSVSDIGRVRNDVKNRIMNPVIQKYACYSLHDDVKPILRTTGHRLVAKHFLKNPKNLPVVCHKDDDPLNNHYSNLFWGTHKDNSEDMVRKGRSATGSLCGAAKLSEEDVLKIRQLKSTMSYSKIAKMYGVVKKNIVNIVHRRTWKHI